MAIDSENKRRSVQGYAGPFGRIPPRPDGSAATESDRRHVVGLYAGQLLAVVIISTLPPAGVAIRFLVGDAGGRVLTELRPAIERVAWHKNAAGALRFQMAKTDPKLRQEYFTPGNRLMLQFDNGLPAWGGVLTGPADWSESAVAFEGVSGEWILAQRRTGWAHYFQEAQAGTILTELLAAAEAFYPLGVRPGVIWQGGGALTLEYHRARLDEALTGETLGAGAFDVTPALENGVIVFYANLYERRGADKPNVALVEGQNIAGVRYREMDEAINVWHMAGDGDGWTDTSRLYASVMNTDSTGRHGMREDAEVVSGVTSQTVLDETAARRLAATAWPARVLGLSVVSRPPGRFADYDIGDAVACRLHSVGFGGVNGLFEVRAREFFPDEGVCDLVLAEVA